MKHLKLKKKNTSLPNFMNKTSRSICFLFILIGFYSFPSSAQMKSIVQVNEQSVQNIIDHKQLNNAFWAISVRDRNGIEIIDINSQKLFRPASNFKLLTLSTALDLLGENFKYQTHIYGNGELVDSTWVGDIIIRGSGDPSISGFLYDENRYFVFDQFYDQLKNAGISAIEGNIIGNDSFFDREYYAKGWNLSDMSFYYAVQVGALSFNNNAVDLEVITSGEVGSIPEITWFPENTDYVEFINQQIITEPNTKYDESYLRLPGTNRIILASTLPQNYIETETLSIDNPAQFFSDSFQKYLVKNGIILTGFALSENDPRNWDALEILATHESKELSEIAKWTNKESDNLFAEMILKTAGAHYYENQGTFDNGLDFVKERLGGFGLDTLNLVQRDGSGLASANLISAENLSKLLHEMKGKSYFGIFYDTFPIAGVDGTLGWRFKNSSAAERFVGKTGFISGARALSGYLDTESGERLSISIMTNNFSSKVSVVDSVHQKVIEFINDNF